MRSYLKIKENSKIVISKRLFICFAIIKSEKSTISLKFM